MDKALTDVGVAAEETEMEYLKTQTAQKLATLAVFYGTVGGGIGVALLADGGEKWFAMLPFAAAFAVAEWGDRRFVQNRMR